MTLALLLSFLGYVSLGLVSVAILALAGIGGLVVWSRIWPVDPPPPAPGSNDYSRDRDSRGL